MKLQLKILIKLLEKITVMYSGTICNLVLDFPSFLDVPVAQTVKNLPAMQETQVRYLGWEDPLEVEMAAHSSVLSWRSPWTEEPGGLQSTGCRELDTTERLTLPLLHAHNFKNKKEKKPKYKC